jgi:2-succinyl-6-hydroxy-2,4-cyclohexadiene-1-carboxylate synthase
MKPRVLALHGFLGRGSDWNTVKTTAQPDLEWVCPDLFAPEAPAWRTPPGSVEGAWLAGYSFGARLALRWLVDEPDRWRGALLLAGNPGNFQSDEERARRRAADATWAATFGTEPWDEILHRWNSQPVLSGDATPPRLEKDFDREKLASVLINFSVGDQFVEVSRLREPLVWMAGTKDQKFSALLGSMREAGFPGVFCEVPRAGHRLLHEAPTEVAGALDRLTA